jgi:hypothetical protein
LCYALKNERSPVRTLPACLVSEFGPIHGDMQLEARGPDKFTEENDYAR